MSFNASSERIQVYTTNTRSTLGYPSLWPIAKRYRDIIKSCSDDSKQYFLSGFVEDKAVRKSFIAHIATTAGA